MHLQNGCGEDWYKKKNMSGGVELYFTSVIECKQVEVPEKVAVDVLHLLLISNEADFDKAKGEVEPHWQIHFGGQGQGAGHC